MTLSQLKKMGGQVQRMPRGLTDADIRGGETADVPYVLGTNHAATEVVVVDGVTYVRGTVRHAPAWRQPDHKRLHLGKEWWLCSKNTVPVGV